MPGSSELPARGRAAPFGTSAARYQPGGAGAYVLRTCSMLPPRALIIAARTLARGRVAGRRMLAFPHFAGAANNLFVANMGTTSESPVWGNGLIDRSLASLWYPTWRSCASEDELVFLIPSLASRLLQTTSAPAEAACDPWRALIARNRLAAERLAQLPHEDPRCALTALEFILRAAPS